MGALLPSYLYDGFESETRHSLSHFRILLSSINTPILYKLAAVSCNEPSSLLLVMLSLRTNRENRLFLKILPL